MLRLKEQMDSGALKPGDPLPTREKLMREYGLSLSTVTRAISELERQGWLISRQGSGTFVAKNSQPQQTQTLDGVLAGLLLPYYLYGAQQFTAELIQEGLQKNINFMVMYSSQDEESELNMGRTLLEKGAQAVIWFPLEPKRHVSVASLFSKHQLPAIIAEGLHDPAYAPWRCVRSDHAQGVREAMQHLVDLGHRRIAYVGPKASESDFGPVPQRWNAYKDIVRSLDQWDPENLVYHPSIFREWSLHRNRIENIFRSVDAPTAILAYNDSIALEVMSQLRTIGLRFPEDVSIIGQGDSESGAYSSPRLTTVSPNYPEFADALIRTLHEELSGTNLDAVEQTPELVIAPHLVQRESTKAPQINVIEEGVLAEAR